MHTDENCPEKSKLTILICPVGRKQISQETKCRPPSSTKHELLFGVINHTSPKGERCCPVRAHPGRRSSRKEEEPPAQDRAHCVLHVCLWQTSGVLPCDQEKMFDGVESTSFLAKPNPFLACLPWWSEKEVSQGTCSGSWRGIKQMRGQCGSWRITRACGLLWTHWGYFNASPSSWSRSVIIRRILITHHSRFGNNFSLFGGHITDFIAGLMCLLINSLGGKQQHWAGY